MELQTVGMLGRWHHADRASMMSLSQFAVCEYQISAMLKQQQEQRFRAANHVQPQKQKQAQNYARGIEYLNTYLMISACMRFASSADVRSGVPGSLLESPVPHSLWACQEVSKLPVQLALQLLHGR